jgi:hypothetical protein
MTSYYDKYNLQNSINIGENKNILKKDYTLDYSDYEKLKISEQYNKIYNEIYNKNKEEANIYENKKIYNLSFNILFQNASKTYINMLNELAIFFSSDNNDKSINKLGYILTKDQNMLYIGLLITALAFFLWVIDVTR